MRKKTKASLYFSQWHRYWFTWYDFWSIFRSLERRQQLEELLKWSKKKQLLGPHRLYQRHYVDIEIRLANKNIRHPELTKWAYFLYDLKTAIAPAPKPYARGSASIYRLR